MDVEDTAEFAGRLPAVRVARHYKYACSDPGQALIAQDIREHNLNRVVVASCSPLLHEPTFRNVLSRTGLNPFLLQMVNIREHVSWVHVDRGRATRKAKDLIAAAVRRVARHKPLERQKVAINPNVLVVGGGIAGIHAALTLADAGKHVYLVEREPTIGGHMAQFDKTFPTLDCAACILTPKMTSVGSHPNITLWTYSEVAQVRRLCRQLQGQSRHKPRYVNEELCLGCQECIAACIFKEGKSPDEFNVGLSKRKPIYLPFPQAVPQKVLIDREACIEFKTGKCKKTCVEACGERKAIDFTQTETVDEVDIGAIVVATGFKTFDASRDVYYGYGRFPNVYTSLEAERLINASGPTGGEVILRDGTVPKAVGIVHCVGSRDHNTNRWCSKVCCMYSLKLAHLIKEHTGAEVYNFYIDMRTPGKGYEEFYDRMLDEGVHFVRGRVAEVSNRPLHPSEDGKLVIRVEDTLAGFVRRIPVDMVVLSVGLEAQPDASDVRRLFNISCSSEGWFLERHPKLAPVSTFTEGVYIAGACQGPKDIPDSVAQAGAASAEALALIDAQFIELVPTPPRWMRISAAAARPVCPCVRTTPFPSAPTNTKPRSMKCSARGAAPVRLPAPQDRSGRTSSRTRRSSRRSKECWPMLNRELEEGRLGPGSSPGSSPSSAIGVPTLPPTWPEPRA